MSHHFGPHMYLEEKAVPLKIAAPAEEEEDERGIYIAYIVLLTIMVIYVTVGTYMERKHAPFGHETGIVIIIGITIGACLHVAGDKVATQFNPVVLFDFGLPFILYTSGYNMRRRRFYDDINNITMFGVIATVVCFILLSASTVLVFQWGWIYKFED